MSYDIRFAVKGEPDGRMYDVFAPEYDSPTYNIGTLLRKAMDWDFSQGEYYRVSDVYANITRGIRELTWNATKYKQYEPDNGWGSVGSALDCLKNIEQTFIDYVLHGYDGNNYDIEYLYIVW